MDNILGIPSTAALLAKCWDEAEAALQLEISVNSPGIDEEAITQNFHAKLSESLHKASQERRVESAFVKDLQVSSLLDLNSPVEFDPHALARNLVADVTLHKRKTEQRTGGDLGLLIIRPNIRIRHSSFTISDYRRGLLAQAKLKGSRGWGTFTKNQQKLLPDRLSYLALLLYSYDDSAHRRLNPFAWQLAAGKSWDEFMTSLRASNFQTLTSNEIIKSLSAGKIGTANNTIIDQVISPQHNSSLTIKIDWPPGKRPSSHVMVYSRYERRRQTVSLRH